MSPTLMQVAQILGAERVLWTDNGIAPTHQHSATGGKLSCSSSHPFIVVLPDTEATILGLL